MSVQEERVAAFRGLHDSGCFVMPNPWDVGSARVLEQLGFPALATTSAGFAWTLGRADDQVTLDQTLEHLRAVCDEPVRGIRGSVRRSPQEPARLLLDRTEHELVDDLSAGRALR